MEALEKIYECVFVSDPFPARKEKLDVKSMCYICSVPSTTRSIACPPLSVGQFWCKRRDCALKLITSFPFVANSQFLKASTPLFSSRAVQLDIANSCVSVLHAVGDPTGPFSFDAVYNNRCPVVSTAFVWREKISNFHRV